MRYNNPNQNGYGIMGLEVIPMKNSYRIEGDITYISAQCQGKPIEILIDTEDLEKISAFRNRWHIKSPGDKYTMYAYGQTWENGKATNVRIHRLVMDTPDDLIVDHINGNGLDNRKSNLRCVNHSLNGLNARTKRSNESGVSGVHWYKAYSKWRARVMVNYKEHHLGYFETKQEAINAVVKFRTENELFNRGVMEWNA